MPSRLYSRGRRVQRCSDTNFGQRTSNQDQLCSAGFVEDLWAQAGPIFFAENEGESNVRKQTFITIL